MRQRGLWNNEKEEETTLDGKNFIEPNETVDEDKFSFTGKLDTKLLKEIFPNHPKDLTEKLLPHLNKYLQEFNMNTCEERIHFFAQIAAETDNLNDMTELSSQYASSKSKYKGRGLIQLTGKGNYEPFQLYLKNVQNIVVDLLNNPGLIATDMDLAVLSAFWYWRVNKNQSQTLSKDLSENSLLKISKLINCGNIHFCRMNGTNCYDCLPHGYERRKLEFERLKQKFNCYESKK